MAALLSNRYTPGTGRSYLSYNHIKNEDELRQLLKNVDDYEERCNIRARIREINEKKSDNKTNWYSDYSSSLQPYHCNEISQRHRRKGIDETAKSYYQQFALGDSISQCYSNPSIDNTYSHHRYSCSSINSSYSRCYSSSSIENKYSSRHSIHTSTDGKYNYQSRNSIDESVYRKYSNPLLNTFRHNDGNATRKYSNTFTEDKQNNNLSISQETKQSCMTDYDSYLCKKKEEENKEIWDVEELSQMSITDLENLLNATRHFKKRRDIRTVIKNLKERKNSLSNSDEKKYENKTLMVKSNLPDDRDTTNFHRKNSYANHCSVIVNLSITPKQTQDLMHNKTSKLNHEDDLYVTSKIRDLKIEPQFYNSSKTIESKILQEINDLKGDLQISMDDILPGKEVVMKVDIKEENHKYPPKRMLSKRSSGYSSSYSSIDDDKEETKDEVFEKEGEKEELSESNVEQLKETSKIFAEIQRVKELESFHPTVNEIDDENILNLKFF